MFPAKIQKAAASTGEWSLAVKTVLGFWALHFVYRTIIYALDGQLASLLDPSLLIASAVGVALSFLLCAVLGVVARRGLAPGLAVAAVLALPVGLLHSANEFVLYYNLSPEVNGAGRTRTMSDGTVVTQSISGEVSYKRPGEAKPTVVKLSPVKQRLRAAATKTITANGTVWFFFYFGLGTFFVGMSSAGRLREAERRAAEFERLAQSAQLRALRYQVNPHFLFNTLNSLSSLIMARRPEEAEAMILSLSAFFRSTLAIDPTEDVTLAEEIALQRLYLDIEQTRFPERLAVKVIVPADLERARVPALLLQPVVENAIKYGVARARERVTLVIGAERVGADRLRLMVDNDGGELPEQRTDCRGTGVGLVNVCERLKARFGSAAACTFGPRPGGGFRVTLTMPLVLNG
jgi:two-component sensor histidine kinase